MGGFHGGHSSSSSGGFHGGSSSSSHSSSSYSSSSSHSHNSSSYSSGGYSYSSYDSDTASSGEGATGLGCLLIFLYMVVLMALAAWAISSEGFGRTIAIVLMIVATILFPILLSKTSKESLSEKLKGVTDLNHDGKIDETDLKIKEALDLANNTAQEQLYGKDKWEAIKRANEKENAINTTGKYIIVEGELPKNKLKTKLMRIFGYVLIGLGVVFFFLLEEYRYTATITSATLVRDYNDEVYEVYTFSYNVNGRRFTGRGDDDAAYTLDGERYFDIAVGEEYTIYASILTPGDYHFSPSNTNVAATILSCGAGLVLVVIGVISRKRFLISIQYVGDLNNDGKIDEADLIIFNRQEHEKRMEELKRKQKNKNRCIYCGEKIPKNKLFCPQCGASRNIENE